MMEEFAVEGKAELVPITPMELVARALASGASMETLEKMLALQERWEAAEARKAFDDAMAKAKAEMPIIERTATVKFDHKHTEGKTSYRHADLADVVQAVAPVLGKHGLSHRFETIAEPGRAITVTCVISHRQGHSIRNSWSAAHDSSGSKNSIQAMGSTVTYLSRYTLMAILGLAAATDDDGTSHREPQAAPDAMTRPSRASRAGPSSPTTDASAKAADAQSQPSAQETKKSGDAQAAASQPRTIAHVQEVEKSARLAASKGSAAFDDYWGTLDTMDDRLIVKGLKSELVKVMQETDTKLNAAVAAGHAVNFTTGEIVEKV